MKKHVPPTVITTIAGVPREYRAPGFRLRPSETGDWYCQSKDNMVEELSVPLSSSDLSLVVRIHEQIHAHLHREKHFPVRTELEYAVHLALTDIEVHTAMSGIMPCSVNEVAQRVLASQCEQKLAELRSGEVDVINAANFALRTLGQFGRVPQAVANIFDELGVPRSMRVEAETLLSRHAGMFYLNGLSAPNKKAFCENRKAIHSLVYRLFANLVQTEQLLTSESIDGEQAQELLARLMQGNRSPSTMHIVEPPRTRPTSSRLRGTRYVPVGGRLSRRLPQALASQRADLLFARHLPPKWAGTVLIDASGSMQIDPSELASVVARAPLAQVAMYSGQRNQVGYLTIFCRAGRIVDDIIHVIAAYQYGSNEVDAEAIAWLLQQSAPRILVTDKQFVFTQGSATYVDRIAEQLCDRAERLGLVRVVRYLNQVLPLVSSL